MRLNASARGVPAENRQTEHDLSVTSRATCVWHCVAGVYLTFDTKGSPLRPYGRYNSAVVRLLCNHLDFPVPFFPVWLHEANEKSRESKARRQTEEVLCVCAHVWNELKAHEED